MFLKSEESYGLEFVDTLKSEPKDDKLSHDFIIP